MPNLDVNEFIGKNNILEKRQRKIREKSLTKNEN